MRLLPLLLLVALPALAAEHGLRVVAWHDVRDVVAGDYDPDQFAVSTRDLIDQFTWLRDNGFSPVSLDDLIAAREGRSPLPDKAVLLTFDDGLVSVYTRVFPLLKLFDYPAVVSVVTRWVEMQDTVDYAGRQLGREGFLSWDQIREMQRSGLVEIASHSHDLHRGIRGNPQGNLQPAAITRFYDGFGYETEAGYLARIDADLAKSTTVIAEQTGRRPRVMTWPYGKYNDLAASVAAANGMRINLTLDVKSSSRDGTERVGRYLVSANPRLSEFTANLLREPRPGLVRVARVDLDEIHDPDPARAETNLGELLDRIKLLKISHVFLKAFADDDADGAVDAVYFPSRRVQTRADLFNRVAWQLKTRSEVEVFASMPLACNASGSFESVDGEIRSGTMELYADLASHAHFDGLFFSDDVGLREAPDQAGTGLDGEVADPDDRACLEFSAELVAEVRRYVPDIKSARNIVAGAAFGEGVAIDVRSQIDSYLAAYDYVVLTTPQPHAAAGDRSYEALVAAVRDKAAGLERTIFELKAADRTPSDASVGANLYATLRWLQAIGVRNLGYWSGDSAWQRVELEQLRLGMSLAEDLLTGVGR